MDIEGIRKHCLQFPHTTENVQWGADLCFKVGNKLFVVAALEPGPVRLSFKCSAESFLELCERPGIRPAPYMARAQWVSLEQLTTLPDSALGELIAQAYQLIWERLPKKRRLELQQSAAEPASARPLAKAKSKASATIAKSRKTKARNLTRDEEPRNPGGKNKRAKTGRS